MSRAALLTLAGELVDALAHRDTRALDVFAALRPEARRLDPDGIAALSDALRKLDFKTARSLAERLCDRLGGEARLSQNASGAAHE